MTPYHGPPVERQFTSGELALAVVVALALLPLLVAWLSLRILIVWADKTFGLTARELLSMFAIWVALCGICVWIQLPTAGEASVHDWVFAFVLLFLPGLLAVIFWRMK